MSSFELLENAIEELRLQMTTALDQGTRTAAAHDQLRFESDTALRELKAELQKFRSEATGTAFGGGPKKDAFDLKLIDAKTMSPGKFSGMNKGTPFNQWTKQVKAWSDAKLMGFRVALEEVEREELPITSEMIRVGSGAKTA